MTSTRAASKLIQPFRNVKAAALEKVAKRMAGVRLGPVQDVPIELLAGKAPTVPLEAPPAAPPLPARERPMGKPNQTPPPNAEGSRYDIFPEPKYAPQRPPPQTLPPPLEGGPVARPALEQTIIDAVAPRKADLRRAMDRNAAKLLEAAPELRGLPRGPAFDKQLLQAYEKTGSAVEAADKLVPATTTIDRTFITDRLKSLEEHYTEVGMDRAASMAGSELEKWSELPKEIPWTDFRDRKRAFFREHKSSSGPAMQIYGAFMDASSKFSDIPALQHANRNFSLVRRAIDAAEMDPLTGRRVYEIVSPKRKPSK